MTESSADSGTLGYVEITRKSPIYREPGQLPDERHAVPGKTFRIENELPGWIQIQMGRLLGWVPEDTCSRLAESPASKLTVAWNHIADPAANNVEVHPYIHQSSAELGLDVISPTWFTREGQADAPDSIRVISKGDRAYVQAAHQNGFAVWGLIADFDAARNYAVYTNQDVVKREIKQIVDYAVELDLDGVNIDFEGFGSRCRDAYSLYVQALAAELRKHQMTVSIDVTRESASDAWGQCYDRLELSRYVDYVAFMAYDEHGRLDVIPGSTGSLPWVEAGIQELLDKGIPREKILLGVPFYTRNWRIRTVRPKAATVVVTKWEGIALYAAPDKTAAKVELEPGAELEFRAKENGWYNIVNAGESYFLPEEMGTQLQAGERLDITVECTPVWSKAIPALIAEYQAEVTYDEAAQQDRLQYVDAAGFTHFVWMEDAVSMEKRLRLVNQYRLPGMAAWMLTQEAASFWDVIRQQLKLK